MVVLVDASYKSAVAGLAAVAGDAERDLVITADSALHAEWAALALGFDLADSLGLTDAQFVTDANGVTLALAGLVTVRRGDLADCCETTLARLAQRPGWQVQWRKRHPNRADTLSRRARGVFEDSQPARDARARCVRLIARGEALADVAALESQLRRAALA